jgi:hypothetical protein
MQNVMGSECGTVKVVQMQISQKEKARKNDCEKGAKNAKKTDVNSLAANQVHADDGILCMYHNGLV